MLTKMDEGKIGGIYINPAGMVFLGCIIGGLMLK